MIEILLMMNLKAHRQRSDKRKQNEQCYLLALSGFLRTPSSSKNGTI